MKLLNEVDGGVECENSNGEETKDDESDKEALLKGDVRKLKVSVLEDELSDDENTDFTARSSQRMRGFEKTIDNLLRHQLYESKIIEQRLEALSKQGASTETNQDAQSCDKLKKLYDRRIYELDTFKSILSKIGGFDYRYAKSY